MSRPFHARVYFPKTTSLGATSFYGCCSHDESLSFWGYGGVPKARMLFWHGLLLKAWLLNIALPHENPEASLVVGFRATELYMFGCVVAP